MKYIVPLGRILYSLIFLSAVNSHFEAGSVDYARAYGVPLPELLVPLSGIVAIIGGFSVAFGYKARAGAMLLAIFIVPVTLFIHPFWNETQTAMIELQTANFMKNVSLLGGALLLIYFGAGPLSFDAYDKMKKQAKAPLKNTARRPQKPVPETELAEELRSEFSLPEFFWLRAEDPGIQNLLAKFKIGKPVHNT